MKYDIFTFNNELDLLDIRLNILNEYIDYFVIVEATETFSGIPKPLYYELNKEKFSNFHHKIIHYIIKDTPVNFDDFNCDQIILKLANENSNVTREHICWLKEFYQKESIKKAIINLNDADICFVSDLDEIWNYNIDYTINIENTIYKPMIENCYINYLNVKTNEYWSPETNPFTGPIVLIYKNLKDKCLNDLRTLKKTNYSFIKNGGWHFNAIGGIEKKIKDFDHPVYTIEYMKNREKGSVINETNLPEYLLKNKEKYIKLFKE